MSVGTAFASEDISDDIVMAGDENSDESLAASDGEMLKDPEIVVTNENFNDYFNQSTGYLLDNVTGDTLTFKGNISNVGVDSLTFNRSITINGDDAVLTNISINVDADKVIIKDLTFNQNNSTVAILVYNATDVQIENNRINFNAVSNDDGFAIYTDLADNLKLINNAITYAGATAGTGVNNAIMIANSNNIEIKQNKFNLSLVSCHVPWAEIPAGSGNWVSKPVSEGIVIESCDKAQFSDNDVIVEYNDISGTYDTIYAVDFNDCDNLTASTNNITAFGHTYIYGIIVTGDDITIVDNKIISVSDVYYANGIDIEGSSYALIANNDITVKSVVSAYAIYSGMGGQNVTGNYTNNKLTGEAYLAFGMSLGDIASTIEYNNITMNGNYTYGVASKIADINASYNNIVLNSSEMGNESIWEAFGVETAGFKILNGTVSISYNNITSQGKGIAVYGGDVDVISNNINVTANSDKDSCAVYISNAAGVYMTSNNIDYAGTTQGNAFNYGDYIFNSNETYVLSNNFNLSLVSCYVPWAEIPAGSGNWVSSPVSEGIVLESCDAIFSHNNVSVSYNGVCGDYDTIYAVDFTDCDTLSAGGNKISAFGHTYIYGIIVTGDNISIAGNEIISVSDVYYANGIDIEGSSYALIANNDITVKSVDSAYAIYSGMGGQNVTGNYTNNKLTGEAYLTFGMSLGDIASTIEYNNITMNGNYTYGIASKIADINASYNNIVLNSSEEGNESVWEAFGVETAGFKILNGTVSISYNNITSQGKGIAVYGGNIEIVDNNINVTANEDKDAYAIRIADTDKINIINNAVDYIGHTKGSGINYAVYILSSSRTVVDSNNFNLSLVSSDVLWFELPAGSGNWLSISVSEGIVFESCKNPQFINNNVTVSYNDVLGTYDTIYAVDVIDCNFSLINGNNITASGHKYIYALKISGDDFTIKDNEITSISDDYYANALDIEGPANGFVTSNNITAKSVNVSYSVYGAMSNGNVSITISDNNIVGNSYLVYGIQLAGYSASIDYNNITLNGNYTCGIDSVIYSLSLNNNNIISNASNEGDSNISDFTLTTGILIPSGDASVFNNQINTTGSKAMIIGDRANVVIKDNQFEANGTSEDVIESTGYLNELTEPNAIKTILIASDLTKEYGDSTQYVVTALDENGNPLSGKTIQLTVSNNTLDAVTDEKGVACFDIDLDVGNYTAEVNFAGTPVYYGKNITSAITVTQKATVITAPSISVLVKAISAGSNYQITLKDNSGNVLSNDNVTVSFNGKSAVYLTDSKGVVNYKLVASKAGTQKLTVRYSGNNNYAASTASANIKISKEASKITAGKKTFKVKKSKKYSITLKDSKGKAISKVTVTLKINGKTYRATTSSNGKATFNIKLTKKGKFTAKVNFAGNNYYNAASASVKITIKK